MKLTRIVSFFFLLAAGTAQAARLADATGVDTTDLTSPGGSIVGSATHASFPTAKLFDDDVSSAGYWQATYALGNMYAVYTFATPTVVDAYRLVNSTVAIRSPRCFRLRGSNDFDGSNYATATWVDLDEEFETGWTNGESRYFRFANATAYTSYALHVDRLNGATDYCQLLEVELYNSGLPEAFVTTTVKTRAPDGAEAVAYTIQSLSNAYVTVEAPPPPADGLEFLTWTGVTPARAQSFQIAPDADAEYVANFYDTATATPKIAYVVPNGAGAKDGTSWENAYASVAMAYNAVGANPGGGEVWVKTGRYSLDGRITMLPRVTVRGGFAGTETSADEADPDAYPTFFGVTTTTNNVWLGTDPAVCMLAGDDYMTLVDPPDDGPDPAAHITIGYTGVTQGFFNTDGTQLHAAGFHGLVFFRLNQHTVQSTGKCETPIVFRKCRFFACNWYMHSSCWVVDVRDAGVDMADCEFVGCQQTVRIATSWPEFPATTSVVARCRFYANSPNWNNEIACGGVAVVNNAKATISSCVFEKDVDAAAKALRAGALVLNNAQDTLVEDTLFLRCGNLQTTVAARNGAVCVTPLSERDVTFNRCRFERCMNHGTGPGAHSAQAAALSITDPCRLWCNDCAFVGNELLLQTKGNGNGGSSCIAKCNLTALTGALVNCLFEGNRAIGQAADIGNTFTIQKTWGGGLNFAIVNCVFKDNDCGHLNGGNLVRHCEIRPVDNDNENQHLGIVNTVFEHPAADYMPWETNRISTSFWHYHFAAVTCSSDWSFGTTSASTYRYAPLDVNADAQLDAPKTNGTVVARGVVRPSPYKKKWVPAYRAANGEIYFHDAAYNAAKPWRLVRAPTTVLDEAAANAIGLSAGMAPIPDAFGLVRRKKAPLGNLAFQPEETVITVK